PVHIWWRPWQGRRVRDGGDRMLAQVTVPDLPVGSWVSDFVDFLNSSLGWLFGFIRTIVGTLTEWIEGILIAPDPLLVVAIFTLIAFFIKGWKLAVFTAASFLLIISMGRFEEAMVSLALVIVAVLIAVVVGTPLGILAAR